MGKGKLESIGLIGCVRGMRRLCACGAWVLQSTGQASRVLSTARLQRLPAFHLPPIDVVVSHDPSAVYTEGGLILGRVSHLDAFSGSPVPT